MMSFTEKEFKKRITMARLQGIFPVAFMCGTAFLIITHPISDTMQQTVMPVASAIGIVLAISGLVGMFMTFGQ